MKVVVDSSVLIDWVTGRLTPQVEHLDAIRTNQEIVIGDLMIVEVLQGCDTDREFRAVRALLSTFRQITISEPRLAVRAAQSYRLLRSRGVTIRKTIDSLIATRCIVDDLPLLFSDRDFVPFVEHLGLRDAMSV